ncbi:MAG: PQQ-dependent dehydrogenase, methanol/ethanol family [Acidobacteria bacterium]|nr:PQQ-dependent dehydrogenase, methanol/ethanol family [Acidobacteriota bacterium]
MTSLLLLLAAQVTPEAILRSPNDEWLTYHGDYRATRHSPLRQITPANARNMAASWIFRMEGAKKLEASPLVHAGLMYVTNTNEVYALDARNGRQVWRFRAEGAQGSRVNRGAAILGNNIYFATADCHLIALNRVTGNLIFDAAFAAFEKGYTTSIAPLALRDGILVGVAGGGSGQRGFVASLHPDTGKERWRFWTVPAKGEPGWETWGGFPAEMGGAPTWTTGSYDAELNTVYWPTGNPWPDFYGGRRPGDNLYSDSVLALDAATGRLKWHFQFTPHDVWDWDANENPVLIDAEFRGRPRKLLVQANRNGYYYILDRVTGEFLHAKPFVTKLDWTTGLDDRGRPKIRPEKIPTPAGTKVCPSVRGASNWMSPAYNPATGLFYVVTLEQCDLIVASAKEPIPASGFRGTGNEGIPAEPGKFYMRALDVLSGTMKWEYPMPGPGVMWAGTVSTAGGVLFSGDDDGNLVALDAVTGKDLWHFATGHDLFASPVTYRVDGRQYVAIAAENIVIAFSLFQPGR